MSELVTKVQEMLKEETWTRATISNYTKSNLIELANILEQAKKEDAADEVKAICDEQLASNRDSIIALYISGMLALKKGTLDTSALETLVDIFRKNHKESVVIYLCESILEDDASNKFALRTLAGCYREDKNEKIWEIYERLVKIDFEEADAAKLLGDHYEPDDKELAIDYYKKALLRYVNAKNYTAVSEVWKKLVLLVPEEIDFFMLVQRKIAKTISADKSALLMQDLYGWYKDTKKWDIAIDILKLILSIDPKDNWARRELVECYTGKYADHSNVADYVRSSNLGQGFRNVFEAINDFEKHIAFDVKHFVYHRTWHVGIIRKVENDTLTINFGKKNGVREMSLKMAVDALQPLADDHIWVLKATRPKDELAKQVKADKAWALKTIIKSFNGSCDFKRIKAELVDAILSPKEWTGWNSAAKKILENDATFGVNPNNINEYIVRDREITTEEKLNSEFKAQKKFFERIDILMRYLNDETTEKESDLFADMFSYFTGYVKSFDTTNDANEQVVASYLVVQTVTAKYPTLSVPIKYSFDKLYRRIKNPRAMYDELKDITLVREGKQADAPTLRDVYLNDIKMLPDWVDQYIMLFPAVLEKRMLDTLIQAGETEKVQRLAVTAFDDFRGYRDAILYFFEHCRDEDWFVQTDIPYQKQLIALLNIIAHSYREINSHVDTTENRKVIRNAERLLFDNGTLLGYMLDSDEATMSHLYTLVDDIADLEGSIKAQLRNKILEKYPDYKFHKAEEKSSAPKGMLVTAKKLKEKQDEETDLQTVQIPQNAQEVSEARAKGDLKENAEYQAAKEHQHYLNKKLSQLQGELARAVIFDPTTATTSYISFGTMVTLTNKDTGKDETYTILGPWESDTDNGIISYMSPFGNELLDHKLGDELDFEINGHAYRFTVKAITLAKL